MPRLNEQHDIYESRGDFTTHDFSGLTADMAWHDLDFSSIVPAKAKAIYLMINLTAGSLTPPFVLRTKGYEGDDSYFRFYPQVTMVAQRFHVIIDVGLDRVIQYCLDPGLTIVQLELTARGWFK